MGIENSSDYDMRVTELGDMAMEHYDLETLHHYDFTISDLEMGVDHFVRMNFVAVVAMLKEGGHLG